MGKDNRIIRNRRNGCVMLREWWYQNGVPLVLRDIARVCKEHGFTEFEKRHHGPGVEVEASRPVIVFR